MQRIECSALYRTVRFISAVFFTAIILSFNIYPQQSVLLRFKYNKGDKYRILSKVHEDIKVNGIQSHHSEIVNRISVEVTETDSQERGIHSATFMTSENSTGAGSHTGRTFSWGEEYASIFTRDKYGEYIISDEYFMPVVRNVPVFPENPVSPGDSWTAEGHEAHDLRRNFNIEKPYKVPFSAKYTYIKDENVSQQEEEKNLQVINVRYNLFFDSPSPADSETFSDYPVTTMGYSNQTIWWDNDKGQIDHYTEEFRIIIETFSGIRFDFTGNAEAEVTEFNRTATDDAVNDVLEKVSDLGLEDVSVSKTEKGLTLSIENIQFLPDSAELTDAEKEKIEKLSQIIAAYPDNDILISGHTARIGTPESCQTLSEQRAESVADFLEKTGAKDKYHIFTQGLGARVPVAPNNTEEGRAKNRRVEITILDQ